MSGSDSEGGGGLGGGFGDGVGSGATGDEMSGVMTMGRGGFRLVIIAEAVSSAIVALQKQQRRRSRGGSNTAPLVYGGNIIPCDETMAGVSMDTVDAAVTEAIIVHGCEVRVSSGSTETAQYIVGVSRALAESPYKTVSTTSLTTVRRQVSRGGIGGVGGGGEGGGADVAYIETALDVWTAQLQQVPGVSADKARALARVIPSVTDLMSQYNDPLLSVAAKRKLLEDKFGSKRKETRLSERVYTLYTSKDPALEL